MSAGTKQQSKSGSQTRVHSAVDKVRDLRARQACVAKILDKLFGKLKDCDPKMWRRRAYLLLVGIIYDMMASGEKKITRKELTEFAKLLAQADRASHWSGRGRPSNGAKSKERLTTSQGQFNGAALKEAVRELYGTNLR